MTIERGACTLDGCDKLTRHTSICSMHLARKARHGAYDIKLVDGRSNHPLYPRWKAMKERCDKKYSLAYKDYGARGIKVCERWYDFQSFLEDMGLPPTDKHTLDRMDNDGGYSPENCRWALRDIQTHNQRPNSKSGYKGIYITKWNTFNTSIWRGKTRINIGTFKTIEGAIRRYKQAEKRLYGS